MRGVGVGNLAVSADDGHTHGEQLEEGAELALGVAQRLLGPHPLGHPTTQGAGGWHAGRHHGQRRHGGR